MACYIENIRAESELSADFRTIVTDAAVRRRMGRIVRLAVATAVGCAGSVDRLAGLDAILTATGWGCLQDSERFLRNMIENDEELPSPTPFIRSTFNTVGGQLALLRSNHGDNVTYANRAHSFEDALLDAFLRLEDGDGGSVLVGSYDELTDSSRKIMERMGLYRRHGPGEGCVFVLLNAERTGKSMAALSGIRFLQAPLAREACLAEYASSGRAQVLYNEAPDYGMYPTAGARVFHKAVRMIAEGAEEVIVYNEYYGSSPVMLKLECIA